MKVEFFEDPWKHAIVDDFFPQDLFDELVENTALVDEFTAMLVGRDQQTRIYWDMQNEKVAYQHKKDLLFIEKIAQVEDFLPDIDSITGRGVDYFKQINPEMMDIQNKLKYDDKDFDGFTDTFKFFWQSQPDHYRFRIHDEIPSKRMSIVVFLAPEKNYGTYLYEDGSQPYKEPSKTIEWKPNRAFIFCGHPGLTWHAFQSTDQRRHTICAFYNQPKKHAPLAE